MSIGAEEEEARPDSTQYSPSRHAVHDQLARLAGHSDFILNFALVCAQVRTLDRDQGAAF